MKPVQFQYVASILGKEHSIAILEELFICPWSSASEIAQELSIHIATAVKYLEEFRAGKIVEARVRKTKAREALEYKLTNPDINLNLNITQIVSEKAEAAYEEAKKTLVKENVKIKTNYEWNEEQQKILRINILKKGSFGRRVEVEKSIILTELEGKFFWNLPYASEQPKPVTEICKKSGIDKKPDILKIMEFIKMLQNENLLEVIKR
ncbi:hypothetical protein [[Eubacterium] cellulosolvens]